MSVLLIVPCEGKVRKKVIFHVPMKVKHHHHTHTVYKHVHHTVPVHFDHHTEHVIHASPAESYESHDYGGHHNLEALLGDLSDVHENDRTQEYQNFERYMKKRSKSKGKSIFNNKVIGWKGRSDFDKIAGEYLASLKKNPLKDQPEDYDDDRYLPYDDDSKR